MFEKARADDARAAFPLIDDVARRMTEGDAPHDLRARVLSRLPAAPASRLRGTLMNTGIAASVAALVIAGVIWSRLDVPAVTPPAIASHFEPAAISASAATAMTNAIVESRRPARGTEVAVRQLPALEPPAGLEMVTIQPERLSIAPLTVAPLVSEPLRIPVADGGGSER